MKITNVEITDGQYGESKKATLANGKTMFVNHKHKKYKDVIEGADIPDDQIEEKTSKSGNSYFALKSASSGYSKFKNNQRSQDIAKAQQNKEESIKLASSNGMAGSLVTAMVHNGTLTDRDEIAKQISYWRSWFHTRWDDIDNEQVTPF